MAVPAEVADRVQRLAEAQRALRRAEDATGVRRRPLSRFDPVREPDRPAVARAEAGLSVPGCAVAGPSAAGLPVAGPPAPKHLDGELVAVPAALAEVIGDAHLRAGSVVQVTGSTTLMLAMAGAACARRGWCAVVGMPDVGLLAAAELGIDLGRTILVPDPGARTAQVLAAIVDGLDVVLLGPCPGLRDRDRRSLTARLRRRGGTVLTVAPWPETDLLVTVTVAEEAVLHDDCRPFRGRSLEVTVRYRGTERHGRLRVGTGGLHPVEEPVLVEHPAPVEDPVHLVSPAGPPDVVRSPLMQVVGA